MIGRKSARLNARLTKGQMDKLEQYTAENGFKNRSAAVCYLIDKWAEENNIEVDEVEDVGPTETLEERAERLWGGDLGTCAECGGPNPLPKGRGRKRKYCSKKCANDYHHRKNSSRPPGYGDKSREAKRLKEERKKEYEEAIKAGWVEIKDLAEQLNLAPAAIHHKIKKHLKEGDTKMISRSSSGARCRVVHPDAIEKIKDPYAIPEGYLTSKQAAEYMGYSHLTFHAYTKGLLNARRGVCDVRLEPSQTTVHKGSVAFLYSLDDLEEFKKNILEYREKTRQESERATSEDIKERQRIKEEQNRLYAEQTASLIRLDDCLPYFNVKSSGPIRKLLHEGKLPGQKIRNRWWFKPEDVETAGNVYKEQTRIEAEKRKKKKNWKTSGHKYKNANQRYEAKQQRKFRKDTSEVALINKKYWEDEEKGIIHFVHCKKCNIGKPYCEFHIDDTYRKNGRRTSRCKACTAKKNKAYPKKPRTLKSKIRAIFGISIEQHMTKMRKEYLEDLSCKVVWRKLEEHCGYDEEKLIKHIESQFVGEMSWDNYGQLGTTIERGNFCWAIDHIKSKKSFHYTSLNDKAFKECWSLDNLRPLETRMNMIKSDKDLRSGMSSSFRDGLLKEKIRGIWKLLPYTPKEARKHFEKRFDKNMNWDNHGDYWHIDHIRPQASLPYTTTTCDNFKTCWSLSNLQPLSAEDNLAKNSVWNDVRWIYNDLSEKITEKNLSLLGPPANYL